MSHIHFYEDGFGNVIASRHSYFLYNAYDPKSHPTDRRPLAYPFFAHLDYPSTYHIAFKDYILADPELSKQAHFADPYMVDVNFYRLATSLSAEQKELIAEFVGLNAQKYREVFPNSSNQRPIC